MIDYPENPNYGDGVFRRRIRLRGAPGAVVGELEDCSHGFRVTVRHDGGRVTDVQGEGLRVPFNTCGGAAEPLRALVGTPIDTPPAVISTRVNPRANCTHMYDLALLAIAHCARGDTVRQIDVAIPDELDEPVDARVWIDERLILQWQLRQWGVHAPAAFAGKPLHRGFAVWANELLQGDEQEAAFVLQKGYLVAQARRYDLDSTAGTPASRHTYMAGACYTYSATVVDRAYRAADTMRDFTDTPEQLLKFL